MSSQHPSIFLSYARVDKPDVERVADTLAAAGLDVFWDKHLDPGSFQEQLEFHLETCDAFVVIVGEHGVSGWVNAETRVALARHFSRAAKRLTIVPLLLGRTSPGDLPSFLRLFQTTHLNDVRDAAEAAGFATEIRHHAFSTKDVAKPKEPVTECPYPGLGTFNAENQPYFFGRDNEVVGALDAFSTPDDLSGPRRWLRIEGTSGVGKSSLLRAGLLPALRQGWGDFGNPLTRLQEVGIMRPGNAPLNALARLLATAFKRRSEDLISRFATPNFQLSHLFVEQALGHEARTLPLLVIDQFEELFTVAADNPEQRERFDRLLAESVADPQCPLYLITTMRSDFVGAFDELPYLSQRRASAAQYELLPISAAGLEDVLEQSVALAGLDYSDAQLAKDVYQDALHNGLIEPGALPLVSNVLRLMWDDRKDGLLQRRTYDALNGLGGAIATQADRLLDSLPTTDQHRVRQLLLGLVEPGAGINTRRTMSHGQALTTAGGGEDADLLLQRLSGQAIAAQTPMRLITADASGVDLIHETLIRKRPNGEPYWPRLWNWIEDGDLGARRRLEQRARDWTDAPNQVALARGDELRAFLAHRDVANDDARRYLVTSLKQRRWKRFEAVIGIFLAGVVLLGVEHFFWQRTATKADKTATVTKRWQVWFGAHNGAGQGRVLHA